MTEFKFEYQPNKLEVSDLTTLFELCKQYRTEHGPPDEVGFEKEVNLICRIDFEGRKTLGDVKSELSNSPLLEYVSPYIDQADAFGIKTISTFRCWVQGINDNLPITPVYHLSAHTHPFRMPMDKSPVNTYTVISALQVNTEITDNFWAKWINNVDDTVTKDWKLLESKSPKIVEAFYNSTKVKANIMQWWSKLREQAPGEEVKAMLPNTGQQMIVNFNSKNWLHGIDDISSNLYLFMLFDDYTL